MADGVRLQNTLAYDRAASSPEIRPPGLSSRPARALSPEQGPTRLDVSVDICLTRRTRMRHRTGDGSNLDFGSDRVGHVYQQTFVDTYAKVACAKLYDRKMPLTAADLSNDRVIPSFDSHEVKLLRMLTDRGSEYCGNPEARRRRENCARREKPCCRSRAGNRLLWLAS